VFAKFEKVIETSSNVISGCTMGIADILNEALEKLPSQNPFLAKINACA
jgi:hypothetical protein